LLNICVTANDFPKFLWEEERVDARDMNKGFLRGGLLIKVVIFVAQFRHVDEFTISCRYFSQYSSALLPQILTPVKTPGPGGTPIYGT